jgi:hypothetical protein
MTEAEWLACADPGKMLEVVRGRLSARKLRLFACACCRRIWELLEKPLSRKAVELAEKHAEGRGWASQLAAVRRELIMEPTGPYFNIPCSAALRTSERQAFQAASQTAWTAAHARAWQHSQGKWLHDERELIRREEQAAQCVLLRDLVRSPANSEAAAPGRRSPTAMSLAQSIYEEHAFDRLPILADALEDAGCGNAELVGHLREPGPHVRGCWALDLILGKQ